MKKAVKSFFLLSFALFFLAGCSRNTNEQAKVGKTTANVAAKNEKTSAQKIDLEKLGPEEKAQVEIVAKQVKALIKMNEEASDLYDQVWGVYLGDFSVRIMNPFRGMNLSLLTVFAKDGIPLRQSATASCDPAQLNVIEAATVEIGALQVKSPISYSLVESKCVKGSAAGKVIAEIKEMPASDGNYFQIRFARDERWIGNSLEAWGMPKLEKDKYVFSDKGGQASAVVCHLTPDISGNLKKLDCGNLGQDYRDGIFLGFERLKWNGRSSDVPLEVTGVNMKLADSGAMVNSVFKIIDNAKEEIVNITEKSVAAPVEDLSRQVKKPTTTPAAKVNPVVEPGATNEAPTMSGDQAIDPNQIDQNGEIIPLKNLPTQEESSVR